MLHIYGFMSASSHGFYHSCIHAGYSLHEEENNEEASLKSGVLAGISHLGCNEIEMLLHSKKSFLFIKDMSKPSTWLLQCDSNDNYTTASGDRQAEKL